MLKKFLQPETAMPRPPMPAATVLPPPMSTLSAAAPVPEATKPVAKEAEGNKLIVGPNIKLKGAEITDCEILVVEGRVEAAMNSRQICISESGVFSGKAEIDVADVGGQFDGELTARTHLIIRSTGKVTGTIRYGTITIEQGGVISGDAAPLKDSDVKIASSPNLAEHAQPSRDAARPDSMAHTLAMARGPMARR